MANKLYEEESIQAIADALRENAPDSLGNTTFAVEDMAEGVSKVSEESYNKGYAAGGGSGKESVGLYYNIIDDETCTVTGIGTCIDADIVIPKTHSGLPVTAIGVSAFEHCDRIRSVVIPDSVTTIESFAFAYTNIEKVYIPNSVTTVGQGAFTMSSEVTVYCEAESRPEGWNERWCDGQSIVWNAVYDIWEINDKFNSLGNGNTEDDGDSDNPEVVPSSLEMPLIRFIGLRGNNFLSNLDGEEQPVQFTVEVVEGSVQVGDTLQICGMRTFKASPKNPSTKRKLRRFAEYAITEDDLDKRVLSLTVYPTKNAFAFLGHNNRQGGGPCDFFFRIRRPVGDLQANDSGMTVDAKFSNVVPVSMLNIVTDIQEDEEGNIFKGVKINVV